MRTPTLLIPRAGGLLILLLGMGSQSLGQVPKHQARIRETTKQILAQPEFRLFPRLKPGQEASGLSSMRSGGGVPRLKSARGAPPELGGGPNEGKPGGQDHRLNNNAPRQRGQNGLPANAPNGNRPGENNPRNPNEALGRDEVFPEAGNVDGLLENPDFDVNPNRRPSRKDLNNRNQQANNNPPENGPGNPANNAPNPKPKPGQPPAGNPPVPDPAPHAGNPPRPGNNKALPAPRPREHAEQDEDSFAFPKRQVGALARFVGKMFHLMAWTILAVICGLILWLIIQAIRDYERPLRFATGSAGGVPMLDLEPAQPPGDLPADVYVSQARSLAEQGRYREAVVQLLWGAMSHVERAGWVRFRRGMTVRDYLRGIHQHPAAYQGFRSIIRVFEPLTFGRREPTRDHFDQSLKGYETGFGFE